jgi:hypothetical protein
MIFRFRVFLRQVTLSELDDQLTVTEIEVNFPDYMQFTLSNVQCRKVSSHFCLFVCLFLVEPSSVRE